MAFEASFQRGNFATVAACHALFPADKTCHAFGTVSLCGLDAKGATLAVVRVYANKPEDLDALIEHATALRLDLATAEANDAERERHQRESEAAEEESLVEEAARQMGPHAEDEHADSSPVG